MRRHKLDSLDSFDEHLMLWLSFFCVTIPTQNSDRAVQGVDCVSLFFCLSKLCSVM